MERVSNPLLERLNLGGLVIQSKRGEGGYAFSIPRYTCYQNNTVKFYQSPHTHTDVNL